MLCYDSFILRLLLSVSASLQHLFAISFCDLHFFSALWLQLHLTVQLNLHSNYSNCIHTNLQYISTWATRSRSLVVRVDMRANNTVRSNYKMM